MARSTMEISLKISVTATENSGGRMDANMKVNGREANNMVSAFIVITKEKNVKDNGLMDAELIGCHEHFYYLSSLNLHVK